MAGREEPTVEQGGFRRDDLRLAAVREQLERVVVVTDTTDALTALMDALDGCQRKTPARPPAR